MSSDVSSAEFITGSLRCIGFKVWFGDRLEDWLWPHSQHKRNMSTSCRNLSTVDLRDSETKEAWILFLVSRQMGNIAAFLSNPVHDKSILLRSVYIQLKVLRPIKKSSWKSSHIVQANSTYANIRDNHPSYKPGISQHHILEFIIKPCFQIDTRDP
jgi:hypothetical protein